MFNKPLGGEWRGTSDRAVRPLMGSLEEGDAVISQLRFKSAVSSSSSSRWCRGGSLTGRRHRGGRPETHFKPVIDSADASEAVSLDYDFAEG